MIGSLRMNTGKGWRGIGENRSQFLWRRNLEREVMSKLKVVDSIYFHFPIHFLFYFLFSYF